MSHSGWTALRDNVLPRQPNTFLIAQGYLFVPQMQLMPLFAFRSGSPQMFLLPQWLPKQKRDQLTRVQPRL